MKKRRSRKRLRLRSRKRRKRRSRKRRRRSRKRRSRGGTYGDFRPKMPPACAKEKKIIKELREKLALRTPLGPRGTRIHGDTPRTTPRSRSVWAKPTPPRSGRQLFPNTNNVSPRDRRDVPTSPKNGGRRRTRKQRGGICPSCIAPLMILPLLGKNKKKKGRRRP